MSVRGGRELLAADWWQMLLKFLLAAGAVALVVFGVVPHVLGPRDSGSVDDRTHWPAEAALHFTAKPTAALADRIAAGHSNFWVWGGPVHVTVDAVAQVSDPSAVEYMVDTSQAHLSGHSWRDRLDYDAPQLLVLAIAAAIIFLTWRVLSDIRTPVDRSDVRHLIAVGLLVGVGLTSTLLLVYAGRIDLLRRSPAHADLAIPFHFPVTPLLAGIALTATGVFLRRTLLQRTRSSRPDNPAKAATS
jgi:hypothetical protein